ncbi:MAG: chorismate mutase, partial [Maribacter sp.]|nr:chorismate mutase [Maribacter sp.]
ANISKLGVIHRGFSTYEKSKYRNIPEWQLAIELQTRFPDLPIINDPSHITGNRDMIFDVSQTALDLNFDGLIIETHHDPENAWSDAAQQVTPKTLVQIMNDLRIRKETDEEAEYKHKLSNLRAQIDIIDNQLIETLSKRMKVSDGIGELKKQKNVAVLQSNRWNQILGAMILEGESKGLSEEFVLKMFKAIHQESINHQEKIMQA